MTAAAFSRPRRLARAIVTLGRSLGLEHSPTATSYMGGYRCESMLHELAHLATLTGCDLPKVDSWKDDAIASMLSVRSASDRLSNEVDAVIVELLVSEVCHLKIDKVALGEYAATGAGCTYDTLMTRLRARRAVDRKTALRMPVTNPTGSSYLRRCAALIIRRARALREP